MLGFRICFHSLYWPALWRQQRNSLDDVLAVLTSSCSIRRSNDPAFALVTERKVGKREVELRSRYVKRFGLRNLKEEATRGQSLPLRYRNCALLSRDDWWVKRTHPMLRLVVDIAEADGEKGGRKNK